MTVHPDPANEAMGWVADKFGNPLHGDPNHLTLYPLVWALDHTGATNGRKIRLAPGRYAWFGFNPLSGMNSQVSQISNSPQTPVILEGGGTATISSPSGGTVITMGVLGKFPSHTFNHIRWQNITFEGSADGTAISIGTCSDPLNGIIYEDWEFLNCEIDGLYDHKSGTGINTKWGMQAYSVKDFVWFGGSVHDLATEHGFYFHNPQGDMLITGAQIWEVGRTAIQIAARINDTAEPGSGGCEPLPANPGDITITGNFIADVGLAPADYHGGTAITITGRQNGLIRISDNHIEYGLDTYTPGLRAAILAKSDYPVGKPYGSGAILHWTEIKTGYLWSNQAEITDNEIVYEQASGDRAAVVLSALNSVTASGNTITMGARTRAIELGNYDSPGDITHPVPAAYCVHGNTLIPGNGGSADLCIEATCCACGQPQGFGVPSCP